MSIRLLDRLQSTFGNRIVDTLSFKGDETVIITPDAWFDVASFLRDDPACDMSMFIDITAVDYPTREARFDLILMLYSLHKQHRIRVKTHLCEEKAGVPHAQSRVSSVVSLWPAANWFECEVWDMFGIRFDGHPDLKRILNYEEFIGHPLRKDYPAQKTQPLVPYRQEALDKQAPFLADEGMPFGRNDWAPRINVWDEESSTTNS